MIRLDIYACNKTITPSLHTFSVNKPAKYGGFISGIILFCSKPQPFDGWSPSSGQCLLWAEKGSSMKKLKKRANIVIAVCTATTAIAQCLDTLIRLLKAVFRQIFRPKGRFFLPSIIPHYKTLSTILPPCGWWVILPLITLSGAQKSTTKKQSIFG